MEYRSSVVELMGELAGGVPLVGITAEDSQTRPRSEIVRWVRFSKSACTSATICVPMQPAVVATPPIARTDQAWFWTAERQRGEAEADAEIARGEVVGFDDVEDLIRDLHS